VQGQSIHVLKERDGRSACRDIGFCARTSAANFSRSSSIRCLHRGTPHVDHGGSSGGREASSLPPSLARVAAWNATTPVIRSNLAVPAHRRALHRTVGAEHTTVAQLRPQQRLAVATLVEEQAGIRRHRLARSEAAIRASEQRFEVYGVHGQLRCNVMWRIRITVRREAASPSIVARMSGDGGEVTVDQLL
jgi:hypothetical protein